MSTDAKVTVNYGGKPGMAELVGACVRRDAADKQFAELVAAVFPVGTRVAVSMGGRRVIGVVVSVGSAWYLPDFDRVMIRNEKTGRMRSFHAGWQRFRNTEILPPAP